MSPIFLGTEKQNSQIQGQLFAINILYQKKIIRTSLVAQWLGIRLPMQGTWVQALVREDPACRGEIKPVLHNYWAYALKPTSHNYWSPRA